MAQKIGPHRFDGDIQDCRAWLRLFGFEFVPLIGWTRADGALGQITFRRGSFHAVYSLPREVV